VSHPILTTYLNDHLAGSVAAIELLDHLREASKGTARENVLASLRSDIEEDQGVLQELLSDIGGKESRVRKATAWVAEKLGEVKLNFDDPGSGELPLLEILEWLALGIQGKLALWRALEAARDCVPQLRSIDLPTLERRALEQHDRVEAERLRVARMALAG
jgi:hypothetical protein